MQSAALRSSAAGSFQAVTPLPPLRYAPFRQKSPVPPLLGTALPWLYLPAIPPHLRREESRRKCSGQAGGSRSGCWRRHCQFGAQLRRSPNCQRLRRSGSARPSAVGVVPSIGQWAVPAQAPEAVCPPFAPVSSASPGSLASPFRGAPESAAPTPSRPPPGPRSTRFARSAPYGTGRLTDAAQSHLHNPRVCETASTIGQPGVHARASVRYRPSYPARTDGKDEYTYTRKQRLPPLRVMLMLGVSFEVLGSYCFA